MSTISIKRLNPREIREMAMIAIQAGLTPFIQSSPGIGKSSIVKKIAQDHRLKLIDHRLATSEPTDMSGLPNFDARGFAQFSPFKDLFPLEGDPLPDGADGWVLFLDEFNQATKEVQSAAYKLILDRMVGQHKLHPNVIIVCAGNLETDRAIANKIGTAMGSRLVWLEMEADFDVWLEDVAMPQNYDDRIIGYLLKNKEKLMDVTLGKGQKTFCCPRTWEFANRMLAFIPKVENKHTALFAGTFGEANAPEFVQFTQVFHLLPDYKKIVDEPMQTAIPADPNLQFATLAHVMSQAQDKDMAEVLTYMDRFDVSFRILFYRSFVAKRPTIRQNQEFISGMARIAKFIS